MHGRHQLLVVQEAIRLVHPGFLQIADRFGDKGIAEVPLPTSRVRHGRLRPRLPRAGGVRCQRWRSASRFNAAIAHPVSQNVAHAAWAARAIAASSGGTYNDRLPPSSR